MQHYDYNIRQTNKIEFHWKILLKSIETNFLFWTCAQSNVTELKNEKSQTILDAACGILFQYTVLPTEILELTSWSNGHCQKVRK